MTVSASTSYDLFIPESQLPKNTKFAVLKDIAAYDPWTYKEHTSLGCAYFLLLVPVIGWIALICLNRQYTKRDAIANQAITGALKTYTKLSVQEGEAKNKEAQAAAINKNITAIEELIRKLPLDKGKRVFQLELTKLSILSGDIEKARNAFSEATKNNEPQQDCLFGEHKKYFSIEIDSEWTEWNKQCNNMKSYKLRLARPDWGSDSTISDDCFISKKSEFKYNTKEEALMAGYLEAIQDSPRRTSQHARNYSEALAHHHYLDIYPSYRYRRSLTTEHLYLKD